MRVLVLGDVGEAFIAFESHFVGLLVKAGEAVTVGAFLFIAAVFGVGVGEHGELVAESVEIVSGPGKGRIWHGIGSGFFVFGMPPATVDRIDESG